MNSKQRVIAAVNHSQVDRLPMSLSGNRFVLQELKDKFGLENHKELLLYFHSDIVDLRDCVVPNYVGPGELTRKINDDITENFWGWRTKLVNTPRGPEEQFYEFKLSTATNIDELEQYNWPSPDWFDFSDFAMKLRPYEDFCIMASGGSVFQHPTFLRGMDNLLMDLALNPDMAEYIMDKFTDFYIAYFTRMFECAAGEIDIFRVADDVAMQTGLLISEEMFDYFVAPRIKKLIDLAHDYNIKFMLHSCGDVSKLIPKFIKLGVDILDPIQVSATNMALYHIHENYGTQICLHGGVDTQQFLPNATKVQVKEKVSGLINYFNNKSGYILSTSHILEGDVSLENIETLFIEGYKMQVNN